MAYNTRTIIRNPNPETVLPPSSNREYAPVVGHIALIWEIDGGKPSEDAVDNVYHSLLVRPVGAPPRLVFLFEAFPDYEKEEDTLYELEQLGWVGFIPCPRLKKLDFILFDVLKFCMKHPPPATIIFVDVNPDLIPVLLKLKQKGYTVMVIASSKDASYPFKEAELDLYDFDSLVSGEGIFPLRRG